MGRKRQDSSAAERLRAFRARIKEERAIPAPPRFEARRKASRPARLVSIESELRALIDEYQGWRDRVPESLQESNLAGKLDQTIDELTEAAEMLAGVDLPKGFGRD